MEVPSAAPLAASAPVPEPLALRPSPLAPAALGVESLRVELVFLVENRGARLDSWFKA